MIYFKCEGQEDEEKKKLMSRIIKNNKDIQETHDRYNSFKTDDEKRMLYEARMKLLRDYNQGLSTGYKHGKEEGIEQGIEQGIEKGELQEKQRVLIRLLNRKFKISESEKELILSVDDPEKLDNALDEIISADTLEDVISILRSKSQQ